MAKSELSVGMKNSLAKKLQMTSEGNPNRLKIFI